MKARVKNNVCLKDLTNELRKTLDHPEPTIALKNHIEQSLRERNPALALEWLDTIDPTEQRLLEELMTGITSLRKVETLMDEVNLVS